MRRSRTLGIVAIRVVGLQVRIALETEADDGLDIAMLAFETGLSMEWITDLCSTPLFYHR